MNLYRVYWLDDTTLRHGVVESYSIDSAAQYGNSPAGSTEYVTVSGGTVNGCFPIIKIELLLETHDNNGT